MSYRKKHVPSKQERNRQESIFHAEFQSSEEVRPLPTDRLTSGLSYQRPVRKRDVDALIQAWDDRLMDPLTVSFRDGKFYFVDGQHRVAAMRKMHDGSEVILPCKIFTGFTYEQEAALCAKLDKSRKPMTLSKTAKTLVESGENVEMVEIRRRLEQEGFIWVLRKKIPRDYEIVVTRAVLNAYHLLGSASFSRMFALIRGAWRGNPASLTFYIISDMALFLKTYETEINDALFIKRMSAVDPEEIIRWGKTDFPTSRLAARHARVILNKYNRYQRGGHKLSCRF